MASRCKKYLKKLRLTIAAARFIKATASDEEAGFVTTAEREGVEVDRVPLCSLVLA
jgi:6,7-dimethyl-8-ribityllumazine synthase